jgi:type IV secretory pathway VirB10-like protein
MKRKSTILLISGVAIAVVISAVALSTHLRLSATEGQEHGNETPQEIANEILTGQPAQPEQNVMNNGTNNTSSTTSPAEPHSESEETPEERAAEGK